MRSCRFAPGARKTWLRSRASSPSGRHGMARDAEQSKETAELVRHEVAFQGYFRIGRYSFRHALHNGGMSGMLTREVFERGQSGAMLPYDPARDEVILI